MTARPRKSPLHRRIVCDPEVLGGKPAVEGTRKSVEQILGLIAKRMAVEDIVEAYPILAVHDVQAAVEFARASLSNDVVVDVRKR